MATRREARYIPLVQPGLRVEWLSEAGVPAAANADLLDISRGGAKLVLDADLAIGSPLTLHFDGLASAAPGKVCWSRPDNSRWWVACSFDPPLSEEVLRPLLPEGSLERRQEEREQVRIPALARWPMGEPIAVDVRDFSAGGLCLGSPQGAERGQRLLLHVGETQSVQTSTMVEVQWAIQFDKEYLIGCCFLHRQGLAAVQRIAKELSLATDGEFPRRARGLRARLQQLKAAWKSFALWADRDR